MQRQGAQGASAEFAPVGHAWMGCTFLWRQMASAKGAGGTGVHGVRRRWKVLVLGPAQSSMGRVGG
jgi:hypothetical protein